VGQACQFPKYATILESEPELGGFTGELTGELTGGVGFLDGLTGARVGGTVGVFVGGTTGDVGPEEFIFISAQFQNCSGAPLPSAGSGYEQVDKFPG
jgi:hypothetical protein